MSAANNISPPRMKTINETAQLTGVAAHRIRILCKTGQISAIQCGCRWLVNLDRFIDYLNAPPDMGNTPQKFNG